MSRQFLPPRAQHLVAHLAPRAAAKVSRKDFTDRLGLPEDASNDEVLAAIDAVKARNAATAAVPASSPEDAVYDRVFGEAPQAPVPTAEETNLFGRLFGAKTGA